MLSPTHGYKRAAASYAPEASEGRSREVSGYYGQQHPGFGESDQ